MDLSADQTLTGAIAPLWQALDEKVLPWASDKSQSRCIVATETHREIAPNRNALPAGVTLSPRPRTGKRVRVPKIQQRLGDKMATHCWPDDGLLCKRTPQLACIISGHSDFRAGDYLVHVPAGHFIIIPPGVPHPDGSRGHTEGSTSCDILWLALWNDVFRCWICRSQGVEHLPAVRSESCFIQEPQASAFFLALAEEASAQEEGYRQVCDGLLLALWTIIHRRLGQGRFFQSANFTEAEERTRIQADDPVALAQQYIRTHLHSHLTLADVAQRVYLSRAQFARRFHQEAGQTFTGFVTQCRLEEAGRLLVETDWPLSTIAQLMGITSAHLRETFTRYRGQTPAEFRKAERHREGISKEAVQ